MRIGLIALAALAAGCMQQPHNNVLLFGTDTKVALDVSSSATSGGAPQLTLGYRRAEAVWMPLVVNDYTCVGNDPNQCTAKTAYEEEKVTDANGVVTERKFPSEYTGETVVKTTSGGSTTVEKTERDAYAVFASFGAKFAGEATGTNAQASGGLAQFFATGVAAQRLAESDGVADILKVANQGEAAAREAEAERDILRLKVSDKRAEEIRGGVARTNETNITRAQTILSACGGGPGTDRTAWTGGVLNSGLDEFDQGELNSEDLSNEGAIEFLATNPDALSTFESNLARACQT